GEQHRRRRTGQRREGGVPVGREQVTVGGLRRRPLQPDEAPPRLRFRHGADPPPPRPPGPPVPPPRAARGPGPGAQGPGAARPARQTPGSPPTRAGTRASRARRVQPPALVVSVGNAASSVRPVVTSSLLWNMLALEGVCLLVPPARSLYTGDQAHQATPEE